MKKLKRFIERFKYWLKNPHRETCPYCCIFCRVYDLCKDDNDEEADEE